MSLHRAVCLILLLPLLLAVAHAGGLPDPFSAGSVKVRTLANGLRLIVREDHSLPIVSMVVVVRGGSGTDEPAGAAHYLEHLVLQGTKRYPGSLAPQLALEQVGAVSNAVTSRDMTRFQATVDSSQLTRLVEVLADVALNPTLDDESFARERPTILAEIQQHNDDPRALLTNLGYQYSFTTHPYRNSPTGAISDVLRLTAGMARDVYRHWFVPNNMSVVLAGDVTPQQAYSLVNDAFGMAKKGTLAPWPVADNTAGNATARHHEPLDIPDTYQLLALPIPGTGDFSSSAIADLVMALLADGSDGLLLDRWTQDGITVLDYGAEYVSSRGPGRLLIWALTAPGDAVKLRQSTQRLLNELAKTPVPPETLDLAKQRLAAQQLMENETYSQQAATLAFYEGLSGAEAASRYIPLVSVITPEQVCTAMPTHLLAWITLGHQPEEAQ